MPKTAAMTLAELKRVGYPFNPTRASNWYGGILASLLAKKHRSDRIDLLAERTLKQMDIDTRGNRRTVILKQVEKAIRSLCAKNILNQYTPERVRIQSGVNLTKFDRYLAQKPLPWSEEEAAVSSADPASDLDEEGGEAYSAEAITSQDDQPDLFSAAPSEEDSPLGSRPVGLPHLPPLVTPVLDTTPSIWRAEMEDGGEIRSPEANRQAFAVTCGPGRARQEHAGQGSDPTAPGLGAQRNPGGQQDLLGTGRAIGKPADPDQTIPRGEQWRLRSGPFWWRNPYPARADLCRSPRHPFS